MMSEEKATTGLEIAETGQRIFEPDGLKLAEYLTARNHVDVIRGPIGSGTSSCSCMRIFMTAIEQRQSPLDGKRRSRWAIVRNTYPMLKDTTIKTWLDWFPENLYGRMYWDRPMHQELRVGDVELDVHFLALDSEDDIRKLRSLELTGVWFNEGEFIPKAIFDEAESRTGRYPAEKDGGTNWNGVIADMNAPNEEHWLPMMTGEVPPADDLTEEELALLKWPPNWGYFVQPPAVLEIRGPDGKVTGYSTNPQAENLRWLRKGYYEEKVQGKKKTWIDSRLRNQIVFVIDGDPVWPSYNPDTHLSPVTLKPVPGHEIICALDFGRRPCALFLQEVNNRVYVLSEFRRYNMSATIFAPLVKRYIEQTYRGFTLRFVGDPKGQDKGQADERTAYDIFRANGMNVRPAPNLKNNALQTRLDAVDNVLTTMHNGMPRFVLCPTGCPTLKAAMAGRYHVRRLDLGDPEPVKDKYSDVADCLQYGCLELGEGKRMIGVTPTAAPRRMRVSGDGRGLLGRRVR